MRTNLCFTLALIVLTGLVAPFCQAESYSHAIKLEKMEFHWQVAGKELAVKLIAKTEGWVGIGFNPEKEMQGADFILGYVKGNRVSISDDFGNRATGHLEDEKGGGKSSVLAFSGTEQRKVTTLEFKIPLDSGEKTDAKIDPAGKTKVLLAYGSRDSFKLGHNERFNLEVNLTTGVYKLLTR